MVDARLVAAVLGVLPFLALFWYPLAQYLTRRRDAVWGALIGLIAFLGPGHAMASLLVDHPLISTVAGEGVALAILAAGTGLGLAGGVWLVGRPATIGISRLGWIAWGATAYFAIHSFADGIVLGEALVPQAPGVPIDGLTVSATVLHRLAEGSLLVLPALLAGWRIEKSLGLLSTGLLTVLGAFLSGSLLAGFAFVPFLAVRSLATGAESGLALILILAALVPQALETHNPRWVGWAAAAFFGILFLHGVVE